MSQDRVSRARSRDPPRGRTLSVTSQSSQASSNFHYYAENASDQIYSGPQSESIPSSYSALHHRRRHSRSTSRTPSHRLSESFQSIIPGEDVGGGVSGGGEHSGWRANESGRRMSVAASISSLSRDVSAGGFKFFTQQEVEDADGASTVANELDPLEYEQRYGSDDETAADEEFFHSIYTNPQQHPTRYNYDHESADDDATEVFQPHDTEEVPDEDRRRRRSSVFDDRYSVTQEPLLAESERPYGDDFGTAPHTRVFSSSSRLQQRFYISEEDVVIAIAGYKSSRVRTALYVLLCISTFGLAYLVLRWFPRVRISCVGQPASLGTCDWVVVENQWGELSIEPINAFRYNRSLSTVFRVEDEKEPDTPSSSARSPPHSPTRSESGKSRRSEDVEYVDPDPPLHTLRVFEYRYIKFIYHPIEDIFRTNLDWADSEGWLELDRAEAGLETDQIEDRGLVFGENLTDIEEKSTVQLLFDEVLHPFYIFQVFSIILWAFDEYYYYAGCIFLISVISVGNTLVETKRTMHRLREISRFECSVRVYRNSFWTTVSSANLVPGDVYELSDPNLSLLPCDSLLLSGECIVNESMLTGESVPVSKQPASVDTAQNLVYPEKKLGSNVSPRVAKSYLYSGTKVISVKRPIRDDAVLHQGDEDMINEDSLGVSLAMVVKTGFATTKGALVRSMLFPKPSGFKFYRDSFKYIGVMAVIAAFGFAICTYSFIKMHLATRLIVLRALDLITIVVPPALPATLTIGTNVSLARLRAKSIYCISPNRVNVGGKLDIACFDKTGTLTEDGLDVLGVRLIEGREFSQLHREMAHHAAQPSFSARDMLYTLATCHELRSVNGDLIGDPLDLKMFEFAGWSFNEVQGLRRSLRISKSPDGRELEALRQFEFVSQLRRMSVLVRSKTEPEQLAVYVKGAPEMMIEICKPSSIPDDYWTQLDYYTHRGYRVIACGAKKYDPDVTVLALEREEVESELEFIGFIVFENRLKPSTAKAIDDLSKANIRTVMCTGDNVLTAISVGRECRMVPRTVAVFVPHFDEDSEVLRWECIDDPELPFDSALMLPTSKVDGDGYALAVTGDAFRYLLQYGTQHQVEQMLLKGAIFARMSPDEKHELVEKLQELDYTTGFCGDGANDCGALKAADVGVSLSEAEASVAAPFTSGIFEISCVLDIISEGRCALTTSFSCFKYMSMYSAIQFVTVSILYSFGSNLGDFQFLWIDLFLILPIAIFMAWAKPFPRLGKKRPTANLTSRKVLVPLLGQIAIYGLFQFLLWYLVQQEPWYSPPIRGGDDDHVVSSDNTALFIASCLQYVIIAIVLSQGPPFRQPMYQNTPFLVTVFITVSCTIGMLFVDQDSGFGHLMQFSNLGSRFKLVLVLTMAFNFAVSVGYEQYLTPFVASALMAVKRTLGIGKKHSNKRYKVLLNDLQVNLGSV